MNEEYLWNKTGEDAEIERLENALQTFRFQAAAPPELPAKILPFEAKNSRRFFNWSLAFASFASLLIVGFGVWFQISNDQIETAKTAPESIAPPIFENNVKEIPFEKSVDSRIEKVETPKQFDEPKFIKVRKTIPQAVRQENLTARNIEQIKPQNLTAKNIETKKSAVKLTEEETYAYDQLMLALSITSSKLRLVSDKIEKQNAVSETER